eukprot:5558615-Karenia_brevis.AAC.1
MSANSALQQCFFILRYTGLTFQWLTESGTPLHVVEAFPFFCLSANAALQHVTVFTNCLQP